MKIFEFSKNVLDIIIEELKEAEKYIRIAIFQMHRDDIFSLLLEKLKKGVKVEIFTLPYDSIHENQEKIIKNFQNLEKKGAKLYFCRWNVGDPGRTTTAVGKWYSFHGKFIVTDKAAIAMTANFTQTPEYDVVLIFKDEDEKLDEFNNKFDELKKLFIEKNAGYDGDIREKIQSTKLENVEDVFNLPDNIDEDKYKDHWILHYPSILCPDDVEIENKLLLIPFNGKGVNILQSVISQASTFVYIVSESFTDPDFPKFLKKISLKDLEIKILCGAKSMDFTDRIQKIFRELLAQDINIRTRDDDIHAKMIITDKHLVITSINLNKISLGFKSKSEFWRENTETITICNDKEIINTAISQFNNVFNESINIKSKLIEKLEKSISESIRFTFDIKSVKSEVKSSIARLILEKEIQSKKLIFSLGKLVSEITKHFGKSQVSITHLNCAIVLYFISKKSLSYEQIESKIAKLNFDFDLNEILTILTKNNFIEKKDNRFIRVKFKKLI